MKYRIMIALEENLSQSIPGGALSLYCMVNNKRWPNNPVPDIFFFFFTRVNENP